MSRIRLIPSLALAGLIGCGPGYEVIPVSGTITWNGKPLADARVTFAADPGNTHPTHGAGQSGPDGTYRLITKDHPGIAPGKYHVIVTLPRSLLVPDYDKLPDHIKDDPLLPIQYRRTSKPGGAKIAPDESEFEVEVSREKRVFDYDIKGEAPSKAAAR